MAASITPPSDEWENFAVFSEDREHSDIISDVSTDTDCVDNDSSMPTTTSQNMENLVHHFEESLASCFRADSHTLQPDESDCVVALDECPLSKNSVWKHVIDNYGLVKPLSWETSHIRSLCVSSLQLSFKHVQTEKLAEFDLDDPELAQKMDFHQIIETGKCEDAVFFTRSLETDNPVMQTADEVIREIEEIMQDADEANTAADLAIQDETGIYISGAPQLEEQPFSSGQRPSLGSPSSQDESDRASDLKFLSMSELNVICQGLENEVKELSSELLQQLHLRDERQFENEIKNTFISSVLEVQYKQEQFHKANGKVKSSKSVGSLHQGVSPDSASSTGRYLTTIIPSSKNASISIDNLQALIKLLNAIKADSEEVPSLLTSYILKVLCPAPLGQLSPSFGV